MAEQINVFGAAHVIVDTGSSNALENLGYSENGPQFSEDAKILEIFGDQNGGDAGIPIDIQLMGRQEFVILDLTKWDDAILNKIRARLRTTAAMGAPGVQVAPGTLMSTGPFRLLIKSDLYDAATNANVVRNYGAALPILNPIELNRGTKYSRVRLAFRCLPTTMNSVANTIWNVVAT